MFNIVSKNVADGVKVTIPRWVAFVKTAGAARTGCNPKSDEALDIAAGKSVKVSAGWKLMAPVK